ncbi:unnamed protein product [Prorocentrum cordatum]|uniref:U-box domain-containing protein n=1 Tax=Prorocentrum cordatum TaxID=2364126 RepID=A0ABN9V8T9_9DINO|nr:unnamed protein product [Polarella glacialis]
MARDGGLLDIPEEGICPISQMLMQDPVMCADGHSYERACIERWLSEGHRTSPKTNALLRHTTLTPNHNLRNMIESLTQRMPALQRQQLEQLRERQNLEAILAALAEDQEKELPGAPPPGAWPKEDLERLSVKALQQRLRAFGLPVSGRKAELVARLQALQIDPEDADAWRNLGIAGGGTVSGRAHSEKECYEKALQINPEHAVAWCNLGFAGGGTVSGRAHSKKECYEKALQINPEDAVAWYNLGVAGGGTVSGRAHSKKECYEKALQINPEHAVPWCNLGFAGGGTVSGRAHSEKECYEKALQINPEDADAWNNLGVAGGGTVSGRAHSEKECYEKALQIDPTYAHACLLM